MEESPFGAGDFVQFSFVYAFTLGLPLGHFKVIEVTRYGAESKEDTARIHPPIIFRGQVLSTVHLTLLEPVKA